PSRCQRPRTTWTYTRSLHDALPIFRLLAQDAAGGLDGGRGHLRSPSTAAETARDTVSDVSVCWAPVGQARARAIMATAASPLRADRKSTRLNSSHVKISYAVFCLKK